MRNLVATTLTISAIAMSGAFAQGTTSNSAKSSSTSSPALKGGLPEAPIGHRQPTAADVGNQQNPADLTPEEKALDRKIKSICRGC